MSKQWALKTKASVFDPATRRFENKCFDSPDPLPGEVTIRVTCCTICGSDIHTYTGRRSGPPECVLGHEIIGAVEGWGGESPPFDFYGKPIQTGQRVTWSIAVGCGECFFCQNDLSQKCTSLFKYGHESIGARGATGGLSEFCTLLPGTAIFPIPETISDRVACPSNCATATVTAALRTAEAVQSINDQTIIVTGLGMLGLTACAMSSEKSARQIIAIDINPKRLELSREFGATTCIHADNTEIKSVVAELTDGRGADIALEFAGVTSAVHTCLDNLRTGGTLVLAGSVFPDKELQFKPEVLVRRMLTLRGIHNYIPRDLAVALDFLEKFHSKYPFDGLVERNFDLANTERAFEYSCEHQPVRVAVTSSHDQEQS